KTLRVYDAATGQLLHALGGQNIVQGVAFSPDGARLATCGEDGFVRIWDLRTGKDAFPPQRVSSFPLAEAVYSPDGRHLAMTSPDGKIHLLEAATGKELTPLNGQVSSLNGVVFSPDSRHVAAAGEDKTVRIWDLATRKPERVLHGHQAV